MCAVAAPAEKPDVRSRRRRIVCAIGAGVLLLCGYFCIGIHVIQPIGAIPDGGTVVYWRLGTELPFLSSADGLQLDRSGRVSLIGRAVVLGEVADQLHGRRITTLPYMKFLYLTSTGGSEFDR